MGLLTSALFGVDGTNPPSASNPFPVTNPGVSLSNGLSTNVTVTTASQIVVFNAVCQNVTINNTSSTNTVYIQPFGASASSANFPVAPGQAITLGTGPGFSQIALYASGSGTVVGILAH